MYGGRDGKDRTVRRGRKQKCAGKVEGGGANGVRHVSMQRRPGGDVRRRRTARRQKWLVQLLLGHCPGIYIKVKTLAIIYSLIMNDPRTYVRYPNFVIFSFHQSKTETEDKIIRCLQL